MVGLQRKVKFQTTYDSLDVVSEDLKGKLTRVNRSLVEIQKSRTERRKRIEARPVGHKFELGLSMTEDRNQ